MKADLTLTLEHPDTLDTLEAVLATARRGGLELHALHLVRHAHDTAVALAIGTNDADRIDLFKHRLRNIIGVLDVLDHPVERLYIQTMVESAEET